MLALADLGEGPRLWVERLGFWCLLHLWCARGCARCVVGGVLGKGM